MKRFLYFCASLACIAAPSYGGGLLMAPTAAPATVGEVAFDAAGDMGTNGGSGAISHSFTTGSGSNRILFANLLGDVIAGTDDGAVSYNGTPMTLAIKSTSGARIHYLFYLLAPTSGAHNVTTPSFTHYAGVTVSSYANVNQVAPNVTAHSFTASVFGGELPITTITDYSWVITSGYTGTNGNMTGAEAGPGMVERSHDATNGATALLDSGQTIHPAGTPRASVVTGSPGASDWDLLSATIVPSGAAYTCGAGYSLGGSKCGVLLTTSGTFSLPGDATNGTFKIEGVGASGGAGFSTANRAGAGGCGAYSSVSSQTLGGSTSYTIGAGGISAVVAENNGAAGGDTSFGAVLVAKGGAAGDFGSGPTGGAGGAAGSGTGTIKNSGGAGGPAGSGTGTGGACGAGGPNGVGGAGSFSDGAAVGAGGGGADGGQAGFNAGAGGASRQFLTAGAVGAGSGAGGAGFLGAGAGGGGATTGNGGNAGVTPIWDYLSGPGAGGGQGGNIPSGTSGTALYGGGIAARQHVAAPNGAAGAIWLTYTHP
jgi:hypothetical protein